MAIRTPLPVLTVLVAGTFAASGARGQSVLVRGPGLLDDVILAAPAPGAALVPWLSDVEILGCDVAGRTPLDDLRAHRPKLREDVAAAVRIDLPGAHGSLFHFARRDADGARRFGWLRVDASGSPCVLLERPAIDSADGDPFSLRIASSDDGASIVVATRLDAGGDVFEVSLLGGAPICRTAQIEPLDVRPNGIALAAGFGVVLAADRILRWSPGTTVDAVQVGTVPAASWFGDSLEFSEDRTHAVVLGAVQGPEQSRPYVFGAADAARGVGLETTRYVGAGYEPEVVNGPRLALSQDAQRVAWCSHTPNGYGGEVFTAEVSAAAHVEAITRDEFFEPYLDEVAVFAFVPGGRLLFAAAEAPASTGAGFVGADVFLNDPAAGPGATVNLTHSSGQVAPPFLTLPTLNPERIVWVPEARAYLLHVSDAMGGRILRVDANGSQQHEDEVAGTVLLERAGSDLLLGFSEHVGEESQMKRQPTNLADDGEDVATSATGTLREFLAGPSSVAALVTQEAGGESLWRVDLATGSALRLARSADGFARGLGVLANGTIVAAARFGSATLVAAWPSGVRMRRLLLTSSPVVVLSGASSS